MKILNCFFSVMLLVSVFGLSSCKDKDPDKPDFTADYPEADKVNGKITIFAKFEAGICDNGVIALAGSYRIAPKPDDEKAWSTDPTALAKFQKARKIGDKDWGAEGWYEVTIDVPATAAIDAHNAILGAKPVHLKDGKFDWDYQIGYSTPATAVEVKSGDVDIEAGYANECNIYFTSNATAAFIFREWKKDPCVQAATHNYTFTVTVPAGTPPDAKITIVGKLGDDGTPLYWNPANEDMVLTKGAGGKYSITINGLEEGTEYKYIMNGKWDNEERAATVEGSDCAEGIGNRKTGTSATINDVVENWKGITTCISEDVPGGTGTFTVTITSAVEAGAKIIFTGNFAEKAWGDSDREMTLAAGKYTWTGVYPDNFECKVIKRIGSTDSWASGGNQKFDGTNFSFTFSFE